MLLSARDHASMNCMTNRPIWILIPLALAILPFSTPLRTGALAGAGPDVINTVWAMWWFQQEWSGAAWGGHSTYFNFPFGGTGAILSPLSAVIWSLFDGIVGPARATTYCNLTILWLMMLAMYFVVRRLGLSSLAAGSASLLLVRPRTSAYCRARLLVNQLKQTAFQRRLEQFIIRSIPRPN